MERRHREDHRAHERKAKVSTEHRRHDHHRKNESGRAEKPSLKDPSQGNSRPRPRPDNNQAEPTLSGDNDYVRRWLVQTEKESHVNGDKLDALQKQSQREDGPSKEHSKFGNFSHLQFGLEDSNERRKTKRKPNSSSDSSLLEAPPRPKPLPLLFKETIQKSPKFSQQAHQDHKKRKAETFEPDISSLSSLPSTRKETFEKRARHKTKEDRYEPKTKLSKSDKTTEKKRSKSKNKGDRKRAAKKAGEDLIRNFSSKNIGQDRLTIRPANGLGLFKNGRASSPAKRRGLPDLAFSEMDFLHHSRRNAPTAKPDHITSKSREKDKRKAARIQDEISDFFKPSRAPLRETNPNISGRASSTYTARHDSIYSKQVVANRYRKMNERSQNPELAKQPESRLSLDRSSTRHGRSPSVHYAGRLPDSTSRLSGKADTYITWSETQLSQGPPTVSRHQIHFDQQRSPTPASIRRSLRDTGIYRDTGIEMRSKSRGSSKETTNVPELENIRRDSVNDNQKVRQDLVSSRTGGTSSSESAATDPSKQDAEELPAHRYGGTRSLELKNNDYKENNDDFHEYVSGMAFKNRKTELAKRGDRRIIIQHFDPDLGWHQRPVSTTQKGRCSPGVPRVDSERAESIPFNREQLAKLARIKRPVTTLPITRSIVKSNADKDLPGGVTSLNTKNPPKVPAGTPADPETSGAELLNSASVVPQNNSDESGKTVSREEEMVTAEHGFINQTSDSDYAQEWDLKEETSLRFLTNPEIDFRGQASVEVKQQGNLNGTKNSLYLGLPIRGGWNPRASESAFQPAKASPQPELQPLFLNQVQRRQALEQEHVEHEIQVRGGNALNLMASDFTSNLPVEDLSDNLLAHQEIDATHEEVFYNDLLYNYNYEQEENLITDAHETYVWKTEEEYIDAGLGDWEMPIGEDEQAGQRYETFRDIPVEQLSVPVEEPNGECFASYGDGDSHPIQGFWKPHRQY